MSTIEDAVFARKRFLIGNLEPFGFVKGETCYTFTSDFMDGEFEAVLSVFDDGSYSGMVIDKMNDEEYEEAQLIIREFQIEKSEAVPDYFDAYFKYIKLKLMYSGSGYQRTKLRTLLKEFGYKRRSAALMESINRTMQALHLQAYLKQHEACDLAEISIDQMVIIRLRN